MFEAIRHSVQQSLPDGLPANKSLLFNRLCPGIDNPVSRERTNKEAALGGLLSSYGQETLALYQQALRQWRGILRRLPDTLLFEMVVSSPLVIGKGDQNAHEFGITLQMPWATPVIPGSAVKGVLSSFAHEQGGTDWHKGVLSAFAGRFSLIMFGGQDPNNKNFAGALDFLDAWWLPGENNPSPFAGDIITVHNSTWYQAGENPDETNWPDGMDSPVPNSFAVVPPGERFLFAIRGAASWRELAKKMLVQAANDYGFGAKTKVGYGRLGYSESIEDALASLPDKSDAELAGLFRNFGNNPDFYEKFRQEADTRSCVPTLFPFFQQFRPEQVILTRLSQCTNWGDLKQLIEKTEDSYLARKEIANQLYIIAENLRNKAGKHWEKGRDDIIAAWLKPSNISWLPHEIGDPQKEELVSLTEQERSIIADIKAMPWGEKIQAFVDESSSLTLPVATALQARLRDLGCDNKKAKAPKLKAWKAVNDHIRNSKKGQ